MAEDQQQDDKAAVARLKTAQDKLRAEIGKVIVGQEQVIDELLLAIFSRGHCILEGVPGLAKTLLISTLARAMSLDFSRIQFTPDLMPSDITGTEVIQENKSTGERELKFLPGPIFANFVLADEINRTPPKTQAALLEAMQERQVTAGGRKHTLEAPFFVLATQNPIEQEGTYPLPEAQQDRFMFKILVNYPKRDEERAIVLATTTDVSKTVEPVLNAEEILALQAIVRRVPVAPAVVDHALDLVRQTRVKDLEGEIPEFVRRYVSWGAGPRASQYLILAAKARAVVQGRYHVTMDDVRAAALPVLRHRILCNFAAEAEGVTPDTVIEKLLEQTPAAAGALSKDPQVAAALSDN
ncbi:MAG: MoxR family ATPase [Planctomycetes bacterium]|nr:MoxR family ATPase [Planctomycetota bacterium]